MNYLFVFDLQLLIVTVSGCLYGVIWQDLRGVVAVGAAMGLQALRLWVTERDSAFLGGFYLLIAVMLLGGAAWGLSTP